jgi:hypothetical protein
MTGGELTVPRHVVVTIDEAFGDGDYALVVDLLRSALEDREPVATRFPCPYCGARFRLPGELDDHRDRQHPQLPAWEECRRGR